MRKAKKEVKFSPLKFQFPCPHCNEKLGVELCQRKGQVGLDLYKMFKKTPSIGVVKDE